MIDSATRDLRYAWRMLWKSPVFTIAAVLTLAIGIGANTAIFTVFNSMVLRPLPYENPHQLVYLNEANASFDGMSVAWPNFEDWRTRNQSFSAMAAMRGSSYNAAWDNQVDMLQCGEVTHELFPMLGVEAVFGRTFLPEDDKPGAPPVVLLSYHTWTGRFASDPTVVGRTLRLNNNNFHVVGVLPPHFHFPHYRTNDIWTPLGEQASLMQERGNHPGIYVLGRLKPGVSIGAAEAEMKTIARALELEYPDSNSGNTVRARALHEVMVEDIRGPMVVLLVAVGLMLLVGCANVANLVLARSSARQSELAVRAAMGAGRGRLARQLFTESALLATVGAAAGLAVAWGGIKLLAVSIPDNLPRAQEISADWNVLGFALAVSLLTGIVFGLAPAFQVSRSSLNAVLREGGRGGSASYSRSRLRQMLVASEFAFAVVLLVGTALMLKSLWNVLDADAGVQTDNVLTAQIRLTGESYKDAESRASFWDRISKEVRSIPGVRQAGIVNPLFGGWQRGAYMEGDPLPKPGEYDPVDYATVTPGAMEALSIRLLHGRLFTEEDYLQKRNYVIVDETFVQKRLADKQPLGQRLKMNHMPQGDDPWFEIIGVVGHVKNYGVDRDSRIEMWVTAAHFSAGSGTIVAKTEIDPASLTPALRSAVWNLDAGLPLFLVRTLDEYVQRRTSDRRMVSALLALFGLTALLLAAIGIYGVMSLSVAQRTQEMGIRLALGAKPGEVLALVVKQGFGMAGIGLAIGVLGSLGLMRLAESQLFGVTATDAISYGAVLVALSLVALAASLFPALRATRVNPVTALRYE